MRNLDLDLAAVDPDVHRTIGAALDRQQMTLEMIASENIAPVAVMQAQDSVLTDNYAEGYPGRRNYGGCENVESVDPLAIDRVKELMTAAARPDRTVDSAFIGAVTGTVMESIQRGELGVLTALADAQAHRLLADLMVAGMTGSPAGAREE